MMGETNATGSEWNGVFNQLGNHICFNFNKSLKAVECRVLI